MVFPSIELVERIVDLFNRSGASELEFSDATMSFRIRRAGNGVGAESNGAAKRAPVVDTTVSDDGSGPSPTSSPPAEVTVTAFMHGVFHRAPAPGEEPCVSIGSKVSKDQQIGILEAMKVFTPIAAPIDGTVSRFYVDNGAEIAVGQPLVTVSSFLAGDAA